MKKIYQTPIDKENGTYSEQNYKCSYGINLIKNRYSKRYLGNGKFSNKLNRGKNNECYCNCGPTWK